MTEIAKLDGKKKYYDGTEDQADRYADMKLGIER